MKKAIRKSLSAALIVFISLHIIAALKMTFLSTKKDDDACRDDRVNEVTVLN